MWSILALRPRTTLLQWTSGSVATPSPLTAAKIDDSWGVPLTQGRSRKTEAARSLCRVSVLHGRVGSVWGDGHWPAGLASFLTIFEAEKRAQQ